jgi:FkbM family methyltransferase
MKLPGSIAVAASDDSPIAVPTAADLLADILAALPDLADSHAPGSATYRALATACRSAVVPMFGPDQSGAQPVAAFGSITFPYRRMGAVDSLDLFGLDELIIFAFYWANRGLYRRTVDIGANIGLHSLIMARCGFEVTSYEPDPIHVELLRSNLKTNGVTTVTVVPAAVSDAAGQAEFVRLLGNTTGSHLAGAKSNLYGEVERFVVPVQAAPDVIGGVDLVKIDAEGQEAAILLSTRAEHWSQTDAMLEIGSAANATAIFDHCRRLGLNLFTQKTGWRTASHLNEVPTSYREGSAFITQKRTMPGMAC